MSFNSDGLRSHEKVSYSLCGLFESRGYKRYKTSRFEEYGLYLENRNFLTTGHVVTFNAPDGRLLALRPDVTLSIAKSSNATRSRSEKLYYLENVCRLSPRSREYEEISQLGLEFFGDIDDLATAEVLSLALRSLAEIDNEFVLDISHMGFISGLLDNLDLNAENRTELVEYIREKNRHDLEAAARAFGVPEDSIARLSAIAGLYGSFDECLDAAAEIAVGCESMLDAIENLRRLYSLLQDQPYANKLRLDFSIVNDIDYYNGVIFQGYVKRVPRAVLSGGRYDNLLARFGHDADAIGFALYLNEISSRYTEKTEYDVDAFILYSENDNFSAVLNAVNRLADCGNRVRAGKCVPDGLRCASVLRLENGNFKEVSPNA